MKLDPAAIACAAGAACASVLAGTVLGVPLVSLVFGLGGGLVAMTWAKWMPWWKRLATLGASTLTGGALAPLFAAILHALLLAALPTLVVEGLYELMAASFIVGAGFQGILQALIAAAVNRINQAGGKPP